MNTSVPIYGNENQSSCKNLTTTDTNQSTVPIEDTTKVSEDIQTPVGDDNKVPTYPEVLSNIKVANLYDASVQENNEVNINNTNCDQETKMSPVEGPVNEIPKSIFDKTPDSHGGDHPPHSSDGCQEFSGQIVYNPDGSAYIIEENDETLLDQIPKQEGSIVERAGKCLPEVTEYPRIGQAVYIARRKAWYNAMGSAYLQFLQGKNPDSPNVHNFKVVSVKDKISSSNPSHGSKTEDGAVEELPEGKVQTIKFKIFSLK